MNTSEGMKGLPVTHSLVRISPMRLLSSEHLRGVSYTETVRFGVRRRGDFSDSVPWGWEEACRDGGPEGRDSGRETRDGEWLRGCRQSRFPLCYHIAETPTPGFQHLLALGAPDGLL